MDQIGGKPVVKTIPTLIDVGIGESIHPLWANVESKPTTSDVIGYDPIYDIAFQFARTHGYSFVVFEDDQTKKKTQRHYRKSPRSSERKSRNAFLPHVPTGHDRKFPVHVVRYAIKYGERCRRKCKDETQHILESIVNDMTLIESAKKDINMVRRVNENLSKLDVIIPSTERSSPNLSFKMQKPQKRRSSSRSSRFTPAISPNRTSASSTSKASVSQQSFESNRRTSPHDDSKGSVRVSNTTEAILSSAPLEDFKDFLSDMCVKIFQDQPDLSPNTTKPITETQSIRTSAEGDIGTVEGDIYLSEKSPTLRTCSPPGRPANLKLKTKKTDSQNSEFLKKYYARQTRTSEENCSLNNAPNDEADASNVIQTDLFGKDEIASSRMDTPSPPRYTDTRNNLYRVCNSISATVFQETIMALRSKLNPCEKSALPVSKIDFVRIKNKSLKMKSLTVDCSQDIYRALSRHLHGIPRTLKLSCNVIHSPPITRIRCNSQLRSGNLRAYSRYPSCVHSYESCHNLFLHQFGSASKMPGKLSPSNVQMETAILMHSENFGETRQTESNKALDNSQNTKSIFSTNDIMEARHSQHIDSSGILDEPKGDKQDRLARTVSPVESPAHCFEVDMEIDSNEPPINSEVALCEEI